MKWFVFLLVITILDGSVCKLNKHTNPKNQHKDLSIKYYTKQTDITIPIMMHLDKALTRILSKEAKHKIREKFKLLAKDILKDVEDLFTHPNLQQKVKLELLDVKILKNNTKKVVMNENVSKYLKSYCQWQGEKKTAKKRWFFSVLFTGLDLYYLDPYGSKIRSSTVKSATCSLVMWWSQAQSIPKAKGKLLYGFPSEMKQQPRNMYLCPFDGNRLTLYYVELKHDWQNVSVQLGRGYMKGMCSNKNSCTLLEWHPQNIAYILTHEIAHSLGMNHDGPPSNECRGQRYIMDAKYNPKSPGKNWSSCNRRELNHFLKSKHAWCLRRDPHTNSYKP